MFLTNEGIPLWHQMRHLNIWIPIDTCNEETHLQSHTHSPRNNPTQAGGEQRIAAYTYSMGIVNFYKSSMQKLKQQICDKSETTKSEMNVHISSCKEMKQRD